MAQASIDGIEFFDEASAGAAFCLSAASGEDRTERIDGWAIETRAASQIVVARGNLGDKYEDAREQALSAANKGLDLLCLRGAEPRAIRHAATEHIVWWTENSETVIRALSTPSVTLSVGDVTVRGGTQVTPPPPQWQESTRYFRLSQLTDDLFDSFRNIYLALESILDYIAPQRRGEREGAWFLRALREAHKVVPLSGHATSGALDPIDALYDELYTQTRNLVFHAKTTRAFHLPHSDPSRRAVEDTTQRAAYLYLALAENVVHLRRPGGGMFAAAWRMIVDGMAPDLGIVVTNDPAPFSADDAVVNPSGGSVVDLNVNRAPEYDRPFEHAFLGTASGREVAKLGHVTRLCSTVKGDPHSAGVPEGEFRVAAVERFEVQVLLRARNARRPMRDFAS